MIIHGLDWHYHGRCIYGLKGPLHNGLMNNEHAVTVLISRQVKRGCDTDFERVMAQIIAVAADFPGHLDAQLVSPGEDQDVNDSLYHIFLAFDSDSNLMHWQSSPARALGLAAAAPYIEGPTQVRQVSGLAHWFQPNGTQKQEPPPRWKVAIVTWLGIFPTVYLVFLALGELLAGWPLLFRTALITALVVILMTWLVAPQLTRALKPWLFCI